jgi:phosphate starvation-inducible PhoH-like protein
MVAPRSLAQGRYLTLLQSSAPIIIGTGPAGTGKTLLACHAGVKALIKGQVSKLVLTRPAVSVDEQHGFLPGSLDKKMEPWTRPMFDCFHKYIDPKELKSYVEICPLAYMRGRTFEQAWIIGDEMQNSTPSQMKMLLTRIGDGSKLIITGDTQQHDRGFEDNGLADLIKRVYTDSAFIHHLQFTDEDVVRHPAIREILSMYDIK